MCSVISVWVKDIENYVWKELNTNAVSALMQNLIVGCFQHVAICCYLVAKFKVHTQISFIKVSLWIVFAHFNIYQLKSMNNLLVSISK